ncbi:Superfamily II DNA and RNA helicase (SNF2 family) (plasmid) [Roseomonas mucosa]|uniref:Superfamily II DNA and RNA helicase (SNF2 family) n=1 Tax=Roseomonas mucosa TaxID=207340 RepID=A0A4Y1MQC7_9PROT|nr:DEAD/DEAH box helicase family protein [Roseomonas mucosa]AWV20202.1 Superfamily II DNA and RNA helicase (SNF2 family) [Roseomonas mucosa]QDD97173.1 Superfamily II DNA and RNA helicase (SNF2 family) [Roseomonas mucosa]
MAKAAPSSQLSLFDTTALTLPFSLFGDGGGGLLPSVGGEDDEEEGAPAPLAPAIPRVVARDFRLAGERGLAAGWKARAADNLAAIRLMQRIEGETRPATTEEQAILARFVGYGASDLANALFRRPGEAWRDGWAEQGDALEQAVSASEHASLSRCTQYAHFTPEYIVRAVWAGLGRLGFVRGAILEPGCGTGQFLALRPEAIEDCSAVTGIEMDPIAARIAALLYPKAWIRNEDFCRAKLVENYDLAIGNPPFSDRTVRAEDPAGRLGLKLHDYFIARAVERLRPGGLAAFVTSHGTLDKVDPKARELIAGMADLVGAIRLPAGSFAAAAGTDVVVDILFLQRREGGAAPNGVEWLHLGEAVPASDEGEAIHVNAYFVAHPEMVLGRHDWTSGPFGLAYDCARDGRYLDVALGEAIARLPEGIHQPPATAAAPVRAAKPSLQVGTAAEGATIKEGSYLLGQGGTLLQVVDGRAEEVAVKSGKGSVGLFARHARIIRGLIPVRNAVREVIRAQEADEPFGAAQVRLRSAYAAFVRAFGPINLTTVSTSTDEATGEVRESVRRPNLQPFLDDPDSWLVSSIEEYDLETGTASRGPIFTDRVIHAPAEPVIVSAADALAVTLAERGTVDLDHIAELLGRDRATVLAELGETVFLDPGLTTEGFEAWQTADEYLSGHVRRKLAAARAAAVLDGRYARNVAALERVQPEDLRPSDITARLGAPWIPASDVAAFIQEVMGVRTVVRHTVEVAHWSIEVHRFAGEASATSEWGTHRRHAGELLDDALNAAIPQIWDVWRDADGEHRQLNAQETEAAKDKLAKIKGAFERWVWTDGDRAERLVRVYNDAFNSLVPRHFSGEHLQLPGASTAIQLRAHQKRVVWRIIASGQTYIAHAVGAGKTFTIAAAIMEQKRLGLISKAMLTVPGHCLAQASREFLQLYPGARILVADETNFSKDRRGRFLARAATANWDCIIITHSAFKFIASPAEFERGLVQAQLDAYSALLSRLDGEDRIARKRIERMKEGMQEKLEGLSSTKDDMLTIAEMGVDQLIADEAQEFRKLSFATNMGGLKGIAPDGSQRAWDLFVKSRFVATVNPGRALVLASGTPITNTLGEMFTLQRFMQPEMLEERGIQEFDAWASNFGDTRTELELQPSGLYKPVTRFSEFVNVADLIAMFRSVADVVLKDDLRQYLRLPAITGGKRQIVTAPASPAFKAYQRHLAERIKAIEARKGKPEKGQDILLSVITDGRHAAIDLRFVVPEQDNEPQNKLNLLIGNAFRIWQETRDRRYRRPDGTPHPVPGAAQMIFSDLGTEGALATRGFSAYRWIRERLIALGVPAERIAFMQDYKKAEAKQSLFNALNNGQMDFVLGSSATMGTGVNAQRRLAALHHLDVPWLPSEIEQREGRIERQGNQNEEIGLYAYATLGSMDAQMWQNNERKARFIAAALGGDRSIRRLEDLGSQANQFAMAKAIASGDPRLMQKAGLEAELARLERQHAAHFDDQHAVRRRIAEARSAIGRATQAIADTEADLARRVSTRGEAFRMEVEDRTFAERKPAGAALLKVIRTVQFEGRKGDWDLGTIGGFPLKLEARRYQQGAKLELHLLLTRTGGEQEIQIEDDLTAMGLVSRLEYDLGRFEAELAEHRRRLAEAQRQLPAYESRLATGFEFADELEAKRAEMKRLEEDLARSGQEEAALAA